MVQTPTPRSQAKADRREAILDAAANLFADRGFTRVSLEELGAAAGISGPAVYRHFSGKQAVLHAMLADASTTLLTGAHTVIDSAATPRAALDNLVKFHVDFALKNSDVIRVQDRDLDSLTSADRHTVRALQRRYVELWVEALERVHPTAAIAELRTRAHATFGLINSTPHSARAGATRAVLERMALAALSA